ncbi:MAG TPA: hypothetical protein EYN51_12350 [Flavobacteriales bacterium]|nr:hypothetical protein [Flavobacteriales bacterium]
MPEEEGEVGNLFFGMDLDTSEFKEALNEARETTKKVGQQIQKGFSTIAKGFAIFGTAIAAVGGGLLLFAKNSLQATNEQLLLADSIGATQAEIAGLDLAAEKFGVEQSMLIDKMREFGGIDSFKEIAEQVKTAGSETDQLAKAQELLGNEGLKLLPILQQGAIGFKNMEMEATKLGLALTPTQIEESRAAWESYESTILTIKGLGKQIGAAFLKPLNLISASINAFVTTFKDDIISAFTILSNAMTSLVQGAINVFVRFGIPFINGFISFAGQIGQAFQDLFDFLSPATDGALSGIGSLFSTVTDFLATFKQSLTFGISKAIAFVIKTAFDGISKFSDFIGQILTGITAGLVEVGVLDDTALQAVSDAFVEQGVAIRKMGADFAKPFVQAQKDSLAEMTQILIDQDKKNTAQQDRFKSVVGKFTLNFEDATKAATESAAATNKAIKKNAEVVDKVSGLVLSGSQEEFNIINQSRNKELEEAIKTRKAAEKTNKILNKLETF